MAFAKVGIRGKINLFFPRMYEARTEPGDEGEQPARDVWLTQEELALIYDKCIIPTVKAVLPEHLSHFPVTYAAANQLYRDQFGRHRLGSIDLPTHKLSAFTTALLRNLNQIPQFMDAFFYHELRGLKGATQHAPAQAYQSLEHLLNTTFQSNLDPSRWWIDVGIEASSPERILLWRRDGHELVVRHTLQHACGADMENDTDLVQQAVSGTGYSVDINSHMYEYAGFRLVTGTLGQMDAVAYISAYTTEKGQTYQLHKGAFRPHRGRDLEPAQMEHTLKDLTALKDMYLACTTEEEPGSTRLEARVSLANALLRLVALPPELQRSTMVGVLSITYW